MPPATKPPAPPSFYSNAAQMQPGPAQSAGAGAGAKKPASEDEVKGIQLMLQLWEKIRESAEGNPEKLGQIQKIVDLVKQYDEKFVKASGEGKPPQPTATEGQGPTPAAAAGGMETQPVPA